MKALCYAFMGILLTWGAHAEAPARNYSDFAMLPILHDGRIKPMDTLARIYLGRLHDSDRYGGKSAANWLAEILFNPAALSRDAVVRISSPALAATLKLEPRTPPLYTIREVSDAYMQQHATVVALSRKESEQLSAEEFSLLELYSTIRDVADLAGGLTLLLEVPQGITPEYRQQLGLAVDQPVNYLTLIKVKQRIEADTASAAKRYGTDLSRYNASQKESALLGFYMRSLETAAESNQLLRIMPAYLQDKQQWYSPWQLLALGHGSPQSAAMLDKWQTLAQSYLAQDHTAFSSLSREIRHSTQDARSVADWQLQLEVWYHLVDLVMLSIAAAIAACITLCLRPRMGTAVMLAAITCNTALVVTRILILERPPVSSLYESILFVALVSMLIGWWMDARKTSHVGKIIGCGLAAFLLLTSSIYAQDGDTLNVLMAVLNTQFWLATHVLCITIGYAATLVAGTMGHAYLFRPGDMLWRQLPTAVLLALFFTAIGTLLGGIWADQSWGRFWGWDPKENGALLIVLWLVWVLHGKRSGQLGKLAFAAWLALGNVVVALSWFGVNLLNVGLHSYGFTDKAAWGLGAFCLAEILLITGLWWRAKQQERHGS